MHSNDCFRLMFVKHSCHFQIPMFRAMLHPTTEPERAPDSLKPCPHAETHIPTRFRHSAQLCKSEISLKIKSMSECFQDFVYWKITDWSICKDLILILLSATKESCLHERAVRAIGMGQSLAWIDRSLRACVPMAMGPCSNDCRPPFPFLDLLDLRML